MRRGGLILRGKTCFNSRLDSHPFHSDLAIRRKICGNNGDRIGYILTFSEEDIF